MCSNRYKLEVLVLLVGLILVLVPGCQTHDEPAAAPEAARAAPNASKNAGAAAEAPSNEIPSAELSAVMEAHFQGVGYMEQYEYGKAARAFREVRKRAPGWVPGAINLAIALLNMTGQEAETAKQAGGAPRWETSTKPFSS